MSRVRARASALYYFNYERSACQRATPRHDKYVPEYTHTRTRSALTHFHTERAVRVRWHRSIKQPRHAVGCNARIKFNITGALSQAHRACRLHAAGMGFVPSFEQRHARTHEHTHPGKSATICGTSAHMPGAVFGARRSHDADAGFM